LKKKVN